MKLSIITVNLNNAEGLRKTIDSVINQAYTYFEHIIIDGGSTDGSVEVIKEYEAIYKEKQRHLYWVSEPDKGIYNGMNKGIKVAKGEYCQFLNSGDWLLKTDVIEKIFINGRVNKDIIYCNIKTIQNTYKFPSVLGINFFLFSNISHPATFTKKGVLLGNLFNEKYKILSDYDFFVKQIIIKKRSYEYLDVDCTFFDINGISNTNTVLKEQEKQKIISNYFPDELDYYLKRNQEMSELHFYKNSRAIQLYSRFLKWKNKLS